jgi:hypothetical protein
MRERVLQFGASQNLVGVLCEPDAAQKRPSAPAVVLWNVGIHHRVGPYRLFTDLARKLAQVGFTSLRFDVAGQGDSAPRRGVGEGNPHVQDLQEALALLEKRLGFKSFAPVAFCSGVDALHPLGLQDERVSAMVYIEPYAWRTRGFWMRYPLRLLNRARWERRLNKLRALLPAAPKDERDPAVAVDPAEQEAAQGAQNGNVFARSYPTAAQFGLDLERLSKRGVRLLFLYFGGDTDVNFEGQLWEMIGRRLPGSAEVVFDRQADHILYRPPDRERAIDAVSRWFGRQFPSP